MSGEQFLVIGGETIGEKAEALREHRALIEEVGLRIPPTIVIASEVIRAEESADPILNEATQAALIRAHEAHDTAQALVIRSSAEGDASGNGVYESRFATNAPEMVLREAGVVVGSFSTESAKDFRAQTELGDDFALMVQPVVGQVLGADEYWENYGPYLSGFGYSSSADHPNGYINVVAGIGGGVSRSGGQLVTPEDLEDIVDKTILIQHAHQDGQPLSFYQYLEAIHEAITGNHIDDMRNDFRSGHDSLFPRELVGREFALAQYLTRKAGTVEYDYQSSGLLSAGIEEPTGITNESGRPEYEFVESEFVGVTKQFMPHKLLEAMQAIEQAAGYPVYVEWALDTTQGAIQPVILQIAAAEQTPRAKLEAEIQGKSIVEARCLNGHGVREANKIVAVGGPADIEHLREFNRDPQNEGYIVLVSSQLSGPYSPVQLTYADCSKAGVLVDIEASDLHARHATGDIVQHLFGASRQTDKFIGEVTVRGDIDDAWQRIYEEGKRWTSPKSPLSFSRHGSVHYREGSFKVIADATTGKLVIAEGTE